MRDLQVGELGGLEKFALFSGTSAGLSAVPYVISALAGFWSMPTWLFGFAFTIFLWILAGSCLLLLLRLAIDPAGGRKRLLALTKRRVRLSWTAFGVVSYLLLLVFFNGALPVRPALLALMTLSALLGIATIIAAIRRQQHASRPSATGPPLPPAP